MSEGGGAVTDQNDDCINCGTGKILFLYLLSDDFNLYELDPS